MIRRADLFQPFGGLRIPHHECLHFRDLPVLQLQTQCDHARDRLIGRPSFFLDGPDECHRTGLRIVHEQTISPLAHHRIPQSVGNLELLAVLGKLHIFRQRN